jgi:hypothetical protein
MTRKRKSSPMVRHLPITKARINLGAVVKQVHLNFAEPPCPPAGPSF